MVNQANKQAIDGILLLDKPIGMSSNAALQTVKRLLQAKKAGHTGSLDPLATGLLPICFGEATKFSQYLLDEDKSYQASGLLGVKTTTGDAEGEVIETKPFSQIDLPQFQFVLNQFIGEYLQCPPMYSALKVEGTPLYKLARQGIEIERKLRKVCIYQIDILAVNFPHFEIEVSCSKGTYIRSLVEDIAEKLSTVAHVTALRRLSVGGFQANQMVSLSELREASDLKKYVLPVDEGLKKLPIFFADDALLKEIRCGKKGIQSAISETGLHRLYSQETQTFEGLIEIEKNTGLKVRRLIKGDV